MNKRTFLKSGVMSFMALGLQRLNAVVSTKNYYNHILAETLSLEEILAQQLAFVLPELGFDFSALEPIIDSKTMQIHHGKHHAAYIKNLNDEVKRLSNTQSLQGILNTVTAKQEVLRNNAGGHYNHSLFWSIIKPASAKTERNAVQEAITIHFGSVEAMTKEFNSAAMGRFGSGWVWLCVDNKGALFITSTPNQDNPLMKKIIKKCGTPIIALDVWEHAYYLNYQNRRKDYVENFWKIVNWDAINELYLKAKK